MSSNFPNQASVINSVKHGWTILLFKNIIKVKFLVSKSQRTSKGKWWANKTRQCVIMQTFCYFSNFFRSFSFNDISIDSNWNIWITFGKGIKEQLLCYQRFKIGNIICNECIIWIFVKLISYC